MGADIIKLTFAVQAALVSGYAAYLIAYAGIRRHHTASDAGFRAIAFSLPATGILTYGYQAPVITTLVAIALSLVAGVMWRWFGMAQWAKVMREARISWADDIPTAWLSVISGSKSSPSQVIVETQDGRLLMCLDTRLFGDAHAGPVVFGLDGDVSMYVTDECRADGEWIDKEDIRHAEGDLLTYVPASQIKRVELRYLSEKAARAAEKASKAAAEAASAEPNPECRPDDPAS